MKEQEKLGEIFKFLKLSPTQFEIIANPARDALEIIRECEKFIFTVMVKRGKMPRKYKIFVSLNNGRLLTVNSTTGIQEKITKIHGSKISRPFLFNKSMYLIKDNAIAKTK